MKSFHQFLTEGTQKGGPAVAQEIIKNGFDINRIKAQWGNDLAISTLARAKDVQNYFGKEVPILEIVFDGMMGSIWDGPQHTSSARDHRRATLEKGIDALRLDSDSETFYQVFIYNLSAIKSISLWQPKGRR